MHTRNASSRSFVVFSSDLTLAENKFSRNELEAALEASCAIVDARKNGNDTSLVGRLIQPFMTRGQILSSCELLEVREISCDPGSTVVQLLNEPLKEALKDEGSKKLCTLACISCTETTSFEEPWKFWTSHLKVCGSCSGIDSALMICEGESQLSLKINMICDGASISDEEAQVIVSQVQRGAIAVLHAEPPMTLRKLDLLSSRDLEKIASWNESLPQAEENLIHTLFETRCTDRESNKPLIDAWDGQLSFDEIRALSNHVAHKLIDHGLQPDSLVPLLFEKSRWAIVAILGILKAGGVFVPLDPSYPPERIEIILHITQSTLVLTSNALASRDEIQKLHAIPVPGPTMPGKLYDPTKLRGNQITPRSPACVFFTSGSTGIPKGVVVEHRSLATACLLLGRNIGMQPYRRVLQFCSFTFDACMLEIFSCLINGGCLCIPSDDDRLNNLSEFVRRMDINTLVMPISVARSLNPQDVPTVDTLVTGGESFSSASIADWIAKTRVLNLYGPTECTIACQMTEITSTMTSAVSIGRAVGCLSWIVDPSDHNILLPVGHVGELLVHGHNVARGYYRDLAKTRSAFVDSAQWLSLFPGLAPARMYKTGDLVKYDSGGTVYFIGRKDSQVKVRGQRVELGDIEHHVSRSPEVHEVVVFHPQSGAFENQLVCVLTLDGFSGSNKLGAFRRLDSRRQHQVEPVVSNIRQKLEQSVPLYMVPSRFIAMEYFPLMPSGKIDRKRMTMWLETEEKDDMRSSTSSEDTKIAAQARDPLTEQILKVFQETIGKDTLSTPAHLSFHEIGGDSIMAMQAVSRLRAQGVFLTVQTVMRAHSLVEAAGQAKRPGNLFEETKLIDRLVVPFSLCPIQQLYTNLRGDIDNDYVLIFTLKLARFVDQEKLRDAFRWIVNRNSMLRARFVQSETGDWSQMVLPYSDDCWSFQVNHALALTRNEALHNLIDWSLNAKSGPVFAVQSVPTFDGDCYVRMNAHHFIADPISWRIIVHQLDNFLRGDMNYDARSPVPFEACCCLQLSSSAGRRAISWSPKVSHLKYWGLDPVEKFPKAVEYSFALDMDTADQLTVQNYGKMDTEPVDVMLGALAHSFNQCFPERGSPRMFGEDHGRDPPNSQLDMSQTVGWFTALYPIDVDDKSLHDLESTICCVRDIRKGIISNPISFFSAILADAESYRLLREEFPVEILFNFLGRFQAVSRTAPLVSEIPEGVYERLGSENFLYSVFEVVALVRDGQLGFNVTAHVNVDKHGEIECWVDKFHREIRRAVKIISSK